MTPSASQTKKKYAGVVPSDSPKRILGELPREQGRIAKVRKLQQEMSVTQTEDVKYEKGETGKTGERTQTGAGNDGELCSLATVLGGWQHLWNDSFDC